MRWFYCITLCCCVYLTSVFAQLKTSDKGKYVTAIIDPNNQGLITIRRAPGTNLDPILSYPQKSFVSIMVGDKIFTNNHTGSNVSGDPKFGGFLDNGVTQKVGDTLRTIWPDKNGCDIIQEVYPVTLEASGQIVIRWKIKNNSATAIWGQGQFLLDLQVGAQNPNDGAPILTGYGYRPIWEKYTSASASGIPWFFAAFENHLPNPPTFNIGVTGVGYNQDANYKLGLKKPSQMTIGDWGNPLGTAALVDFLWGVSAAAPLGTSYTDAAIHFQWEGLAIPGGKTVEVASTSYGTGEFSTCTGQLFGVVFYPRHFQWVIDKDRYKPDTAKVEIYAFNVYSPLPQDPNHGPISASTSLKLHCGPNLHIVDPVSGKVQSQLTQPTNGEILQYGVGRATWKIVPDKLINCKEAVTSWLKFTAESSFNSPVFFNSGVEDTCEHPIIVDCSVTDFHAPLILLDSSTQRYLRVRITEEMTYDTGLDSIWFEPLQFTDITKFTMVRATPDGFCQKDVYYEITQLDPSVGGCFTVRALDCAGNEAITNQYCFPVGPGSVDDEGAENIELIGNPASERTTLRINVSASHAATIRVVDLTGREVHTQQARLLAGRNDLVIGTSWLAEGIYYVIADWDGRSYAKKLTVIK